MIEASNAYGCGLLAGLRRLVHLIALEGGCPQPPRGWRRCSVGASMRCGVEGGPVAHGSRGRFLRRVGHTPREEIAHVQFRRVEQLLVETDLPLAAVAARAGFRHTEYMTVAFTRRYGVSPSRWRIRRRASLGEPPRLDAAPPRAGRHGGP